LSAHSCGSLLFCSVIQLWLRNVCIRCRFWCLGGTRCVHSDRLHMSNRDLLTLSCVRVPSVLL
jgi:hypothetical protein